MKKVIVFVFILLFSANVYAADFSSDPNDFAEIVDTTWKFTIGFDLDDYIVIKFYDIFKQDDNGDLYIACYSIDTNLNDQIGLAYYIESEQEFICMFPHPSGYIDWFEVYKFAIADDSANGTFCNFYGTTFGSEKWLHGDKIENSAQDPNILNNSNPPSIPDSLYPDSNNNKKDDDNMFGCFISLLRPYLLPCRATHINIEHACRCYPESPDFSIM